MTIEDWWPALPTATRELLIAHNGEPLAPEVVDEVVGAGGPAASDSWWVREEGLAELSFPDEAVDWIEAIANDEAY